MRHFQRLVLALLLVTLQQVPVQARILLAHLFDGGMGRLFETGFASVNMVKAACNFTRQLNMCHLVFPYRDLVCAIDEDVSTL